MIFWNIEKFFQIINKYGRTISDINFYRFHLFLMNENVAQVEGLSFQVS